MELIDITQTYIPIPKFKRPPNVKNDTHHVYSSEKYEVEFVFRSSMFYGPEFYSACVKDKLGNVIWNGGDAIFLDSFFNSDFLSDKFDKLILTFLKSADSDKHMQILLVDLKTAKEEVLTKEDCYLKAGHLLSFDAVYYDTVQSTECIDYTHNRKFNLKEIFAKYFTEILIWGSCPVNNCVLVITKAEENNVHLFNIIDQKIVDTTQFVKRVADHNGVRIVQLLDDKSTLIRIDYSNKGEFNVLESAGSDFFKIVF